MAASYPTTIKIFTTKHNITDIVDQGDVNGLQDEVVAIEGILGVNPHMSAARGLTYGNVDARLEGVELDYSLGTHTHAHSSLTGDAAGDNHTQYMLAAGGRHDLATRHAFGAALPTPAVPTTAAIGDAAATGAAAGPARADHLHGMPGFAAPTALTIGIANAAGVAVTLARSDHRHGLPAAAIPVMQAVGDAAAEGAAGTIARSDHRHGMPGFAAVSAATTFGIASANGVALTLSRSDHQHGSIAVGLIGDITTAAMGDAAAAGASGRAADAAHRHGMPAFGGVGAISTMDVYGIAPDAGTSVLPARIDHNHGTPDPTLQGPSGVICMYGGDVPPSGWSFCDGAALDRTTYATLFGIIGTRFGPGDGVTTFNKPDFRNRVPLGLNTIGAAPVAGTTGAHTHAGPTNAGSAHNHTASSAAGTSHGHSLSIPSGTGAGSSHNHVGATGTDSVSHHHNMKNHVHIYIDRDAPALGNANTGAPSDNTSDDQNAVHVHNFTTSSEAGHTHGIGAGSIGNEAGHTHAITTNNESTHTHAFITTNVSPVAYLSVAFIIKT